NVKALPLQELDQVRLDQRGAPGLRRFSLAQPRLEAHFIELAAWRPAAGRLCIGFPVRAVRHLQVTRTATAGAKEQGKSGEAMAREHETKSVLDRLEPIAKR